MLGSVPESLSEVIALRVSRLGPDCRHLLTLGSVVGREFSLSVVENINGVAVDHAEDAPVFERHAGVLALPRRGACLGASVESPVRHGTSLSAFPALEKRLKNF